MANPIVHFELPADDLERARVFYSGVFGWKITDPWKMEYYLVETKDKAGNGINGGMMKRKGPGQPFTNYVLVDEIDDTLAKITAGGGKIAMPKTEIGPGLGWIAAFIDPENNIIGLHQTPPAMKHPAPARKKTAAKKASPKNAKPKNAKPKNAKPKSARKVAAKTPARKPAKKAAKKKPKRR